MRHTTDSGDILCHYLSDADKTHGNKQKSFFDFVKKFHNIVFLNFIQKKYAIMHR